MSQSVESRASSRGAGTGGAAFPPATWNATDRPYRADIVPVQLIVEAAHADPDAPALLTGDGMTHTYGELLAEANRLARLMQSRGVGPGDCVGVVGRHRPDTVVAQVAAALTGATFVPCHPDWPANRLGHVLETTRTRCLVGGIDDLARLDGYPRVAPTVTDVVVLDVPTPQPPPLARPEEVVRFWDEVAAGAGAVPAEAAVDARDRGCDAVAGLVLAGGPSSVLEIGVGAGAMMRQVAPHVDLYAGLDPSERAVRANLEWAEDRGLLVHLVPGFAHEVADLLPGTYDVAVLADTVQHLPGVGHLRSVLAALAEVVRPGGEVVLGGIVAPGAAPEPGWLTLPPEFFATLRGGVWSSVRVQARDDADEQRCFDVVLQRGEPDAVDPQDATDGPRIWTGWHVAGEPATDVELRGRPGDVAYIIFTSGSTGRPKGVAISNTALVNMLQWVTDTFSVGPADRLLQVTSFCFDLSIYDVFGLLSAGGSIRMATEEEIAEPARLAEILLSEPITFWNSAPPLFAWVLPFLSTSGRTSDALRLMFLAGDWIALSLPDETKRVFPSVEIVSYGGATETTVWATYHVVAEVDPDWASIPYGRPIWNTRYYVLDEHRRPVPIDEPGDLYAAGTCLALGYHGDPAQTAQRFVPDPFVPGERMYALGDRGRWRPDGEMQFLGRVDHQVKIRGYRVELGEIESVMAAQDGVRESVVVTVDIAGEGSLAAFYTCRPPGVPVDLMRAALVDRLPEYMVPLRIVAARELPLTANGKVDRVALAELARQGVAGAAGGGA